MRQRKRTEGGTSVRSMLHSMYCTVLYYSKKAGAIRQREGSVIPVYCVSSKPARDPTGRRPPAHCPLPTAHCLSVCLVGSALSLSVPPPVSPSPSPPLALSLSARRSPARARNSRSLAFPHSTRTPTSGKRPRRRIIHQNTSISLPFSFSQLSFHPSRIGNHPLLLRSLRDASGLASVPRFDLAAHAPVDEKDIAPNILRAHSHHNIPRSSLSSGQIDAVT